MRTEAVRHWRTKARRRACGGWRETATKAAGGRVSAEHKSGGSATCQRVRLSCQRRQKRSVKAGLAIEDIARGRGRGKVRSAISAAAPQRGAQKSWAGRAVRVGEHRSETCRPSVADKSEPLASVPAQSPLGDGRGDEHRGDGRGVRAALASIGERRPDLTSSNSGAAELA